MTAPAADNPTPRPIVLIVIIVFILCGIFYVFGHGIVGCGCKILNENKLECELELYFKNVENENINVNCEFDFGALSPTPSPTPTPTTNPTPAPRPTTLNFINSRAGLREQLVLEDIFGIVYGGEYDCNNVCEYGFNENFCNNNGYNYPPTYPTPYSTTPTPALTIIFTPRINILKGVCGVGLCESNIDNELCNEINNTGM